MKINLLISIIVFVVMITGCSAGKAVPVTQDIEVNDVSYLPVGISERFADG